MGLGLEEDEEEEEAVEEEEEDDDAAAAELAPLVAITVAANGSYSCDTGIAIL